MDIKIDKGDHVFDSRGIPVRLEGLQELLQRARIAVAVPMGALPWFPHFGGDRLLVEKGQSLGDGNVGFFAMAENALSSELFKNDGVRVVSAILDAEGGFGTVTLTSHLGEGSFEVII